MADSEPLSLADSKPFDHKSFLESVSTRPGVYDMRDGHGKTLYIGKAKNLKNRLSSYFRATGLTTKTMALVSRIVDIEVTVTQTETEALLLEQNLIKDRRPQYNILLRDDKSYPYIFISDDNEFPRMESCRGRKRQKGKYFGPYPSGVAVKDSLHLLQKVFKIRSCTDSYFRNRTRPCLQYQIDRCKAPCVGLVSEEEYAQDIHDTSQFLEGKSQQLIRSLIKRMETAAESLDFEAAAALRDQISHLRAVQEQQSVTKASGNVDVIGFAEIAGKTCFDVLFIRSGHVLGHKYYFPEFKLESSNADYLEEFVAQFYVRLAGSRDFPDEIVVPFEFEGASVVEQAVESLAAKKLKIKHRVRSERHDWLVLANKNAQHNLESHLANKSHLTQRYQQLSKLLGLSKPITRMECFDISHTMGEATVASCVVFGAEGPKSSEYRRYNISGIEPGDDYAAMNQALKKRYHRLASMEDEKEEGGRPDLIIIDGGKGQLTASSEALAELELQIPMLGVAKGVTRKAGLEKLLYDGKELNPEGYDAALLLIQQIRDEAHRFAITGHRQRRQKARNRSVLDDIPGVGSKRRSALLKFFGGKDGVYNASVDELTKVEGISRKMAQQIHDYFHND
ncbi:excinuclease ABC subunit UvrC [Endozoicomonas ascidiicola]|uniref:excinuclease ABC subunit UvrC n=1 Tax=Endozoicomonas ascidiicola TaxID=1698521 RepID=UPI00082A600E|nr:excinuclease ABC subunit UvrC [Endozoicomonas ascidiicola]